MNPGNRADGGPPTAGPGDGAAGPAAAGGDARTAEALSQRAAGENFPVALRFLPGVYRQRLMALYRFARLVDDIGDEPSLPGREPQPSTAAGRLRALDVIEEDLERAFSPGAGPRLAVVRDVGAVATACAIPAQTLRMLIQANRQDQTVRRYETFDDLRGYCRLSADPVGRAVLCVFGVATDERERLSDLVCTALQLAEHWQDVAEDLGRDRVYLPQEDMAAFGCTDADLAAAAERRQATAPVRRLMRFETQRARRLLDEGAALTGTLRGWARIAVAGYVAGGRATLAAIAASGRRAGADGVGAGQAPAGFDVFAATPRPGRAATAAGIVRAFVTGR